MIILASKNDFKAICDIEYDNFTKEDFAMSKASIRYHLKHNIVYVITDNENIVGYALYLKRKYYFRLYSIAILKKYHGKGLGEKLLKDSISIINKSISLEVKETNQKAINLYIKNGFKIIKKLINYYPGEKDGLKMVRS